MGAFLHTLLQFCAKWTLIICYFTTKKYFWNVFRKFTLFFKFWQKNPQANIPLSLRLFHNLLKRILTFGMPTVCVVNGHAIAGGVFLALAHDHSIMVSDPKYNVYLNEL